MSRHTDDDELFAAEMADVVQLEQSHHRPQVVWREPVPVSEREREVLRELDALVAGTAPFEIADTQEFMAGGVRGLDPRVLKRLRRGDFTPQADLDLHGTDLASARALVERFVCDAWRRGLRCLRIVHGRGLHSPGGPVLKPRLPRWLSRGPARQIVLAWSSAPPRDGGLGALYVLLRKAGRASIPP